MGKFNAKVQDAQIAFNFDNIQVRIGHSALEPRNIDTGTRFSTHINLGLPFVASPMDTVTESQMAIALARRGAIGVIHRNCSIEEEVDQVAAVKRAESFIIRDVKTITKDETVKDAAALMDKYHISALPVVEEGRLVGIITSRDVSFTEPAQKIAEVMIVNVITAGERVTEQEAIGLMKQHRIEKLPIVDDHNILLGLITRKDINLRAQYTGAARDSKGRLLVAAAVSPFDLERAKRLVRAGADALVIDVAHFDNETLVAPSRQIIAEAGVDVVVGNLGTTEAVKEVLRKLDGAAGLRMGIGSGYICKTTEVTGAGAPTPFAVAQAADALEEIGMDIPIIADGGIKGAGHIAVALALGASTAMMGYVFAGCDECPTERLEIGQEYFKVYRGMGSNAARAKRAIVDRYADSGGKGIEEGIVTTVPWKGPVDGVIDELVAGLRASMGYAGAVNIEGMREAKIDRVLSKPQKAVSKATNGR